MGGPLWSIRAVAHFPVAVAACCVPCCQTLDHNHPALAATMVNVLAFFVVAVSLYIAMDIASRVRDKLNV